MHSSIFANIVNTQTYTVTINGYPKTIRNTNELLGNVNGVYGIKTGFTNGANRCLVSCCKRENMDIICVVLGADTKNFRTRDSIKLIEYTFKNFEPVDIKEMMKKEFLVWKEKNTNNFFIEKGISNTISIKMEELENNTIPILKDKIQRINIEINCQKHFIAPLPANNIIGNISLKIDDITIAECHIITEKEIKNKSILDYIFTFFKNYKIYLENITL